jgi:Raf kinase inhibitor-like YbhB/YbcL family protein
MRRTLVNVLLVLMSVLMGAEKIAAQQQAPPPPPSKFTMTTSAYSDGNWIPAQYACGVPDGTSPGVRWSDPPAGTMSFALILHDTDAAPGKGAMDVTHWILWNIAASTAQLPPDVKPDTSPDGIVQGKNIRGVNGYQPPCPPVGARPHHYIFELYALDTKLDLPAGSSRADLLKAIDTHAIGKASYVGIFGRGIDPETWRHEMAKP